MQHTFSPNPSYPRRSRAGLVDNHQELDCGSKVKNMLSSLKEQFISTVIVISSLYDFISST